jgi:hypothetical protein
MECIASAYFLDWPTAARADVVQLAHVWCCTKSNGNSPGSVQLVISRWLQTKGPPPGGHTAHAASLKHHCRTVPFLDIKGHTACMLSSQWNTRTHSRQLQNSLQNNPISHALRTPSCSHDLTTS